MTRPDEWARGPCAPTAPSAYRAGAQASDRGGDHDERRDAEGSDQGQDRTDHTCDDQDRDRGQTAVEYLGIIVVVVAIVVAITGTDIGNSIKDAITRKIADLTGGK